MQFYAQPYDTSTHGFYFSTKEEFDEKYAQRLPVEEYEISFIEGEPEAAELAVVWDLTSCNLEAFIELAEEGDTRKMALVYGFLLNNRGYIDDALKADEDCILGEYPDAWGGDDAIDEYAQSYLDDTGALDEIPSNLRPYFDVKAYARDMRFNGEVWAFEFCRVYYVWDNHA